MRTTVVLDDALVREAFALTGVRTIKQLLDLALRELVLRRRKKSLLELAGKVSPRAASTTRPCAARAVDPAPIWCAQ